MMQDGKSYKVSAKRTTGKWWTFGSLKKNQFGNWSIGLRVTPELKDLIEANDGKYINFALFEDEGKREVPQEAQTGIKQLERTVSTLNDEIPF